MPKSKLRGGAKAHKLRVATRNNALRGLRKKAQAEYQEMFEKQMEEMKAQYQNENGEITELNAKLKKKHPQQVAVANTAIRRNEKFI